MGVWKCPETCHTPTATKIPAICVCKCVLIAGLFSPSQPLLGQTSDLLLMQRGLSASGTASGIITSNWGGTFFSSHPILIVSVPAASRKV